MPRRAHTRTLNRALLPLLIGLALAGSMRRARASNYALEEIPMLIPAEDAQRLRAAGVATTFALLEKGSDPKTRKALATTTKIPAKTLDGWIKMADLMRVRGVGPDVARLLTAVGVLTVADLQKADAQKTADAIAKVAASQKLSENPPSAEHLTAWIAQAKNLPIVLR
jgi:predicted flap endonuclease-1-like 5' DNA nuclease